MAQAVRGGDRTVWVVRRDERMMEWFSIVRVANMQTIRWVLGALNGWASPVSTRQAQSWCARMRTAGLIDLAPLGGGGGSLVWATFEAVGRAKPNLYRQTTRHEIAVAAVSARYAAAGYAWQRDDKAPVTGGHQADGVALGANWVELLEIELTAKRTPRYSSIFAVYRRRLDMGDATQLTYLCNDGAARAVRNALRDIPAGREIADQVAIHEVFDHAGLWAADELPAWLPTARARAEALAVG